MRTLTTSGPIRPIALCACLMACGLFFVGGCASAVQAGTNTALDDVDLVRMTDDMARQIAADPEVRAAVQREGSLAIVLQPVENRMRAEVLPQGPAEAFTARVRALLSNAAPGHFTWVMNRDAFHRLRGRELDVDLGPPPERVQPTHALTAVFSSLADEHRQGRSAYYVCVYELTDLRDGRQLWAGSYEVKKVAVKGWLD